MVATMADVRECGGQLVLCRTECPTLPHVADLLETERRMIPRSEPTQSRPRQESRFAADLVQDSLGFASIPWAYVRRHENSVLSAARDHLGCAFSGKRFPSAAGRQK